MRVLDRYVTREVLGPLGLGFLVYTFILLMQFLFKSAEMIIRRGLPVEDVGRLLVLTLPNIVVLTIPMAFLFGILVAIGRLASDSELVAMRGCGVSLFALYRPILALSLVLTLLNGVLTAIVLPLGNHALQQLRLELLTKSVTQQVQPRVFYEEWEGLVLYVFETSLGGAWKGVFLAESLPANENQVTVAREGRVRIDDAGERLVLELEDAYTHTVDFSAPARYEISHHQRLQRLIEDRFGSTQRAKVTASKGIRELTLSELFDRIEDPGASPELRNLARVEIHKKFAIPFACLVFGLFALPLGFNNRRGGKSSGFAISLLVILAYYVLLNNGEEAARVGTLSPWLAMWLPNILLTGLGVVLLAGRNRDKSLLLGVASRRAGRLLARFVEGRRARRRARRSRRAGTVPDLVVRLPRLRLRFPNLLDRYVLRLFGWVFLLVMVSGLTLYIVADLSDNMDDILDHRVPARVVLDYYKYAALQMFYDLAPIMVLVTTLITFGLLSRTNEVTVIKALGASLYRLALPAVLAAGLVAMLGWFLQAQVLPAANEKVARLNDRIKGRETVRTYRRADRNWLFGQGRYVYNYLRYDDDQEALQRLQVFELGEDHLLIRRLFAESARFAAGAWVASGGWARSFAGLESSFSQFDGPRIIDYPEPPTYFESEVKQPEQMSYRELERYLEELRESGQEAPEIEVELHSKLAFPLISLVMALVALPFAFRLGRRGALYGIGLALVLGMVFLGVYAFFRTLGETAALPPLLAVWSPNILFTLYSLYLFLGVRT